MSIILDDAWWDKVQYLLRFTEPILTMIRVFYTDMPCLGEVYENIDSMLERIREIIYVAQVSGTRVRRVRGHEYPIRLEASPKFAGNVGLGAAIIYINFF